MDIDLLTKSRWRLSDEDDSDSGLPAKEELGAGLGQKKEAEDVDELDDDIEDKDEGEEELENMGFHEEAPEETEEED